MKNIRVGSIVWHMGLHKLGVVVDFLFEGSTYPLVRWFETKSFGAPQSKNLKVIVP